MTKPGRMTDADVDMAIDALPVGYNRAIVREYIAALRASEEEKDALIKELATEIAASAPRKRADGFCWCTIPADEGHWTECANKRRLLQRAWSVL